RRGGADQHRGARYGAPRGPHPSHAADGFRFSRRLRGDLGATAAQRLRLRMADLPGDFAEPTADFLGSQAPGAGGGRAACPAGGGCRGPLPRGKRAAHCRGRARTPAAERARETDRLSLAAMFFFAALCLVAGILPGFFIDALAPVVQGLVGDRMPVQGSVDWLSIVPIAESRSSYNGLLV